MDLADYCWASKVPDLPTHITFNKYGEVPCQLGGEQVRVLGLYCELEA
jgi:hypothetical protein